MKTFINVRLQTSLKSGVRSHLSVSGKDGYSLWYVVRDLSTGGPSAGFSFCDCENTDGDIRYTLKIFLIIFHIMFILC